MDHKLIDLSSTNKVKPWTQNKRNSLKISSAFFNLDEDKRSTRMIKCGGWLKFNVCSQDHSHPKILTDADFCRERMCPMCAWRRSLKISHQVREISHQIHQNYISYPFLFLTLTVPNVPGARLSETISHLMASFKRLFERKEVKKIIVGYFRSLEVTYSLERDDYHPHFHVLLCANSNYFKDNYIKQTRWLELWRESTRQSEVTQVDIRRVGRSKKQSLERSASEVAKYLTKFNEFCGSLSPEKLTEVTYTLSSSLASRRLCQYGGLMRSLHKSLHLEDPNELSEGSLIDSEGQETCECSICSSELFQASYGWNREDYFLFEK